MNKMEKQLEQISKEERTKVVKRRKRKAKEIKSRYS